MIELQIDPRFDALIMIVIIMGSTISFIITISFITLYRANNVLMLKLFRAKYFYAQWINQDNSFTRKAIRSSQVKNSIIKYNHNPYITTSTPFSFSNKPLYVYHYNNPTPITLMEYSKNIKVDGQTYITKDILFATNKQTEDSKKMKILMETKIIEEINKIPIDKWSIINLLMTVGVMAIVGIAIFYVQQIQEGLVYTNEIVERIAVDNQVQLPEVKPNIFKRGGQI